MRRNALQAILQLCRPEMSLCPEPKASRAAAVRSLERGGLRIGGGHGTELGGGVENHVGGGQLLSHVAAGVVQRTAVSTRLTSV